MEALLWLSLALPAIAGLVVRLADGTLAARLGVAGGLASVLPPIALLVIAAGGESTTSEYAWLPATGIDFGLALSGTTAAVSTTVALVGAATLVYSSGYFQAEVRASSVVAGLLLFVAAMQGLVLSSNLLTMLIFWELVGASSARLIAFNRDDPSSITGAVRAFLTTRTADLGFYVAIAALFAGAGSVEFEAARPEGFLGLAVGVGLVVAAAGKSAQIPFQTWLAGAMAGPTPVSALLHSATMVAAGAYLLIRAQDLLAGTPLEIAVWLGAVTAVVAAAIAFTQRDLKLVLASSTTSQLGLMFAAAGAGVPGAALFHLIVHAAAKAGMFFSAGVFQQWRGGTALHRLRGVARTDRIAFWGFVIGAASVAAVPPLAGFWSKDAVLAATEERTAWFVLAALGSVGTAAYMLRPVISLRARSGGAVDERHPGGRRWMWVGIGAVSIGSVLLGLIHTPLSTLTGASIPAPAPLSVGVSLFALASGAILALVLRGNAFEGRTAAFAAGQFGTDPFIEAVVISPVERLSRIADGVDRGLDTAIDRIATTVLRTCRLAGALDTRIDRGPVDGLGRAADSVATFSDLVERLGIDRAVDGTARFTGRTGGRMRQLQAGRLYVYLRDTGIGIATLVALFAAVALLAGGGS